MRANLQYKQVLVQEARDTKAFLFGTILAIILGLSGVPALATEVVEPLFAKLEWREPGRLTSLGIAGAFLLMLILLTAVPIILYRRSS